MIKETCHPALQIEMKDRQKDITLNPDITIPLIPVDKSSGTVFCERLDKDGTCKASPTRICWRNHYDLYTTVTSKK